MINKKDILEKLIQGKISFRQLPEELTEKEKAEIRRKAIEVIGKADLSGLGSFAFDPEIAGKRNCENLIGGISIPVGLAGPIKINGISKAVYYIPLATTEGALIASVSRGCKAVTLCGGVNVNVEDVGMSRAPVFTFPITNYELRVKEFTKWVEKNFGRIAKIAEGTSEHLKLLKIEPIIDQEAVFLRFSFNTGLAMGMNMVTIAVAAACELIERETGAKLAALSGNVCCDKKAARINFEKGRGKKVNATVTLSREVLRDVLKTTAKDFYDVYRLKVIRGSKIAGTIGANAQMANTLAAVFIACGQDLAHVTEGAIGITTCKLMAQEGLEVSVYLPDLPIGVIGGGTGLTTQKECLGILGLLGKNVNDSLKLAEIIGGVVLAGEISLLAALSSNDLARAHARLAQNKILR